MAKKQLDGKKKEKCSGIYTSKGNDQDLEQLNEGELKTLLTEYQKTQDSAEHHDSLNWQGANSLILGAGGLLVFILNLSLIERTTLNQLVILLASFGFFLCVCSIYFSVSFIERIDQKYASAKEIEKSLLNNQGTQIMNNHTQANMRTYK